MLLAVVAPDFICKAALHLQCYGNNIRLTWSFMIWHPVVISRSADDRGSAAGRLLNPRGSLPSPYEGRLRIMPREQIPPNRRDSRLVLED